MERERQAQATDIPMMPHTFDAEHERDLGHWARGWEAAAAFYRPRLDNLEAECDRLHLRAYNKPEDVKRILARRVDAGLAEYEWHFMRGEVR